MAVTSGSVRANIFGHTYGIICSWKVTSTNYANNNYSVNFTTSRTDSRAKYNEITVKVGSTYVLDVGNDSYSSLINRTITLASGATFELGVGAADDDGMQFNYGTFTLPAIDRKSNPTLSATSVTLGNSITLTTNRKASSFTHTIQGGFSTSSLSNLATSVGASTTLSFPVNTYAPLMPNNASRTYYIRTITYSGSTNVGQVDKTITLNVPSDIVPTLTNVVAEDAWCYKDLGIFYNRYSKLALHGTEGLAYSSPIVERSITFNGQTTTSTTSSTVTMPDPISFTTIPQTTPEATFTIKDGRGRTASATVQIPVIDYSFDVSNHGCYRSDANGNENPEGTYITITGTYTKTPVLDGNNQDINYVSKAVYINGSSTPVYTSGDIESNSPSNAVNATITLPTSGSGTYAINSVYDVKVVYGDSAGGYREYSTIKIPTAIRPISVNSNGTGISFGIPCTSNGMEIAYTPVNINGDVSILGGSKNANGINADGNLSIAGDLTVASKLIYSATGDCAISHVGMIIMSTKLNTMEKVIAIYGGTTWIQHSGYMLRGASSGVTGGSGHNVSDGGVENVTLTKAQCALPEHGHGVYYKRANITVNNSGNTHVLCHSSNTGATNWAASNANAAGAVQKNHIDNATSSHTNMPPYKNVYIWERTA